MKKKFSFLVLAFPFVAFGQSNSSIDLVAGLEHSYRSLSTSSTKTNVVYTLESRNARELAKLNWRAGFNYNRRLSNRFHLKTGIRLASVGHKDKKQTGLRYASEFVAPGVWVPDPSLPHEVQFISDYWFIEIPLAGRFEFSDKKIAPFLELSVAPSVYITTRNKTITDLWTSVDFYDQADSYDFNRFHLVGIFSVGVNFTVSEKIQLFGQPTFRYHLTQLADAPIEEHLFNYGIEIGLRRKI
jgi:hypothetical protein